MSKRKHKCKKGARWSSERNSCVRRVKRHKLAGQYAIKSGKTDGFSPKTYLASAKSWLSKHSVHPLVPNWSLVAAGAAGIGWAWYASSSGTTISSENYDTMTTAFDYSATPNDSGVTSADAFKAALAKVDAQWKGTSATYGDIILRVAQETGVSPFTIYALGQLESAWGLKLTPKGPSGTGDQGHGRGLMQVDDRPNSGNTAWLAANNWEDPYTNITKGAQLFLEKQAFFIGNAPLTYKSKTGATITVSDGSKVTLSAAAATRRGVDAGTFDDPRPLADEQLLDASLASYNTGQSNVLQSLAAGVAADLTSATNHTDPVTHAIVAGSAADPGVYLDTVNKYLDPINDAYLTALNNTA